MQVTGRILRVEDVSSQRRDEMFQLMTRHYAGMSRSDFDRDLDEKDWVIEVSEGDAGALCGFSTQMLFDVDASDRPVRVLFSGDTIVDPNCRHRNPLAGLWGQLVLSIIEHDPSVELYWFLISKGYKTYRFLPTFFHEFYPRFDVGTPRWAEELLDTFGRYRYPQSFDGQTGLIRAGEESCRLRPGVADVSPARLHEPHVRYFLERNPHHMAGDELCCLASLTRENFTRAAFKVIEAEQPQFPEFSMANELSASRAIV